MAAAKEFNIGKDTLVDFLAGKGFSRDDLKPTAKLTEDMYRALQTEFQNDKVAKLKSDQIDLPKGSVEARKKKEEEPLFKKETKKPAVEEEKPEPKKEEKENVNENAEGDDEVFKTEWTTVKQSDHILLSEIKNFDELASNPERKIVLNLVNAAFESIQPKHIIANTVKIEFLISNIR